MVISPMTYLEERDQRTLVYFSTPNSVLNKQPFLLLSRFGLGFASLTNKIRVGERGSQALLIFNVPYWTLQIICVFLNVDNIKKFNLKIGITTAKKIWIQIALHEQLCQLRNTHSYFIR